MSEYESIREEEEDEHEELIKRIREVWQQSWRGASSEIRQTGEKPSATGQEESKMQRI